MHPSRHVPVITEVEDSPAEQLHGRQVRYFTLMGVRLVCFVVAAATAPHWFAWIFIAGFGLSWPAVLIANDRPPLKPGPFTRFVRAGHELPAGPGDQHGGDGPRVIQG